VKHAAALLSASLLGPLALAACEAKHSAVPVDPMAEIDMAAQKIDISGLLARITTLSSDEFEGRQPGTNGEKKTVDYLSAQFEKIGLRPGNPDGEYVQNVPLVGINGTPSLSITVNGQAIPLEYRQDFVGASSHFEPEVAANDSDVVFVGYGVQAPEYGWDDYKGLDVRGKTLVMLINDPAIPDPADPRKLDDRMFRGKAMTYYGRWTYKYDIASELGAAAAIIVHETEPAAYPWTVVQSSWTGEQFKLANPDGNKNRVPFHGWMTVDKARQLFEAAGYSFDALKQDALKQDFHPVELPAKASFHISNEIRQVTSHNIVALLPGSDPALRKQYVIYTAHWDHFGSDPALNPDHVYNGAVDNATGTAAIVEIAEAFAALPKPPKRSILFLAVTAEEQGLLGSQYYAENPLYPLDKTVATINIDAMNVWGPTRELQVIGMGQNTLENDLADVLARHGRVTVPDSTPEKGSYFRSDQFNFAKQGVPSIYADDGSDVIGKPGYGEAKRATYTANDYHKPSDEIHSDWDLSGTVDDTQAMFELGALVANRSAWPTWKDGSEFKAKREAMLKSAAETAPPAETH
jgi:Zn-dependent M28 family amino/carboxypeptidase